MSNSALVVMKLSDPQPAVPGSNHPTAVDIDSDLSAKPASLLKSTLPIPAPSNYLHECIHEREIGFDL